MLVETVEPERRGQTLALAMSVITCGTVTGPAIAGTMFQLAGYWAAWSVPLALLGLDAIARLAMLENPSGSPRQPGKMEERPETPEPQECAGLLSSPTHSDYRTMEQRLQSKPAKTQTTTTMRSSSSNSFRDPWSDELTTIPLPSPGFYRTMLFNPGVLAGLANTLGQSLILAAFDTTLPLFLRHTFGWGSMPVGLIFLGLQGPIIVLGPVVGGMRDRMGCRIPTVVGWGIVAPFLLLLAMVGRPEFAWAASGFGGEVLVVGCITGIGLGFLLIRGGGGFQVIGMVVVLFPSLETCLLTDFWRSCYQGTRRSGS
jgi:MFS family permease